MVISWKGVIPMVSSSAVITIDRCPQSHDSAPLMLQPLLFAPADALAVARARQVHKEGWAKKHREQK